MLNLVPFIDVFKVQKSTVSIHNTGLFTCLKQIIPKYPNRMLEKNAAL